MADSILKNGSKTLCECGYFGDSTHEMYIGLQWHKKFERDLISEIAPEPNELDLELRELDLYNYYRSDKFRIIKEVKNARDAKGHFVKPTSNTVAFRVPQNEAEIIIRSQKVSKNVKFKLIKEEN